MKQQYMITLNQAITKLPGAQTGQGATLEGNSIKSGTFFGTFFFSVLFKGLKRCRFQKALF